MSTWVEDARYNYYGSPIRCVRRYFDGQLEMVDLAFELPDAKVFTRAACTLAPCVLPRVTETLGGVTAPAFCDHRHYERVTANAGPHVGAVCCAACGTPAPSAEASGAR